MRFDLSLAIEIRPLREADLDELEWDSEQAIDADYIRRTTSERRSDVVFLLALANGHPVGRLGLDFGRKADQGIVHLWAFSVLPSLQRLGIGTALVRAAEELVAEEPRGATLIEIGVDEWNDDAARLYRRLGYRDADVGLLRRPVAEL